MQCPLCRQRPARRSCPAKGFRICSVCCGTLRQREIACPADCPYLAHAQAHPAAAVRRQQELDAALAAVLTEGLSQQQAALATALLSVVAGFRSDALFRLVDNDVAEAAGALAATCETAGRGVIYEHRPQSLVAHRLYGELKDLLDRSGLERSRRLEEDAALVLRRFEVSAREARTVTGLGPTAWVEMVGRLLRNPGSSPPGAAPAAQEPPPSLLIRP
jgi:hypothetical protein